MLPATFTVLLAHVCLRSFFCFMRSIFACVHHHFVCLVCRLWCTHLSVTLPPVAAIKYIWMQLSSRKAISIRRSWPVNAPFNDTRARRAYFNCGDSLAAAAPPPQGLFCLTAILSFCLRLRNWCHLRPMMASNVMLALAKRSVPFLLRSHKIWHQHMFYYYPSIVVLRNNWPKLDNHLQRHPWRAAVLILAFSLTEPRRRSPQPFIRRGTIFTWLPPLFIQTVV